MSKTLEQVVLALPCDGATTLAIIGALKEAGLVDATVYDGPGTTVSVVTKELRERAADAVWKVHLDDHFETAPADEWLGAVVNAVLSTVLGKTRMAKEIQTVVVPPDKMCVQVPIYTSPIPRSRDRCYTIAILEDDDG